LFNFLFSFQEHSHDDNDSPLLLQRYLSETHFSLAYASLGVDHKDDAIQNFDESLRIAQGIQSGFELSVVG
jgi:hypothetical protein